MSEINFIVGISGSGKTSWTQSHATIDDVVIDSDEMRAHLFGDPTIQSDPSKVFNAMFQRVHIALQENKNVWYTATNLKRKHRVRFVNAIKKMHPDVKLHCYILVAPPEVCIARDAQRERTVGEQVIMRQLKLFTVPGLDEGWDDITCYKNWDGNFEDYKKELWGKVEAFGSQENPHHTSTLYDHCVNCGVLAYKNKYGRKMVECATYHDVGKIYTKVYWDDGTGIAHYPQHANVSAYLALCCGLTPEQALLINYHMVRFARKEEQQIWANRFGDKIWQYIQLLNKFDMEAH